MIRLKDILNEKLDGSKVICDKCHWSWNISDGGNEPYTCHKCGNDNTPISEDLRKWFGKGPTGGWKVAKEGVQNNIDEAIHPETFREFMQACNDAGLNSFQIFGMHVLVYILTLGATGLTMLSALGIAQLAKDAKDTFNNWNAGRKLNPEKVKAIVKDFENKVNKLEGGRKKFFQGIINKMKRTNPENKSALVSINRDLEHYAQAYGIKDESVIKEVEVGEGHENDRDMVTGVAEILRMVDDMNNRKEIAEAMLRKFKSEDVIHNAEEFLTMCGM